MKLIFLIILNFFTSVEATTWKKLNNSTVDVTPESTACPDGYVGVPALYPYTTRFFCVMKYEAKKNTFDHPTSLVFDAGPWVSINRNVSRVKCKSLGTKYDLISNDQWQTIARNIAGVAWNWSSGTVGSGEINRGHSDNSPSGAQIPDSNDSAACVNTGQTCSDTVWNAQRRTHKLSNGSVIWDFAGNVAEWVTNNSEVNLGVTTNISMLVNGSFRQIKYGAHIDTLCASPSTTPFCGMGGASSAFSAGAVARGGHYLDGVLSGIFHFRLDYAVTATNTTTGFRCVYVP